MCEHNFKYVGMKDNEEAVVVGGIEHFNTISMTYQCQKCGKTEVDFVDGLFDEILIDVDGEHPW